MAVTVILPALNEEKTITQVINFCFACPDVTEVIVVDDSSEDATAVLADQAGARVIASAARGKGISMKEGIAAAHNELLVFLDADIHPYPPATIEKLIQPLKDGQAEFVKACFSRNAGRVTELVAKPLLSIFFPGISHFQQPLGGMMAGRKSLLQELEFFNDYGVDIGILIDMYLMKARVTEVSIGYIENKSKSWEGLGKMSREVSKAIIVKARESDNAMHLESEMSDLEEIQTAMQHSLAESRMTDRKMILLDVDGTILTQNFIEVCAKELGFYAQLEDLRHTEKDPLILTKRIGLLLKGATMDNLLDLLESIDIVPDFIETITAFRKKGYLAGMISHGYTLVTNFIQKRSQADFAIGHQLEFFQGRATGEVNLPSAFFAGSESVCGHSFCKTNAMQYVCVRQQVLLKNCIAVGDGMEDRCLLNYAGTGVSFCTQDPLLETIAKINIRERSFRPLSKVFDY